jgi:two-component system chemotaxis response regulator CheY
LPIKEEVPKMALNVLIVDDSAVMRAMILKTLHMSGMPLGDIHQAANGR